MTKQVQKLVCTSLGMLILLATGLASGAWAQFTQGNLVVLRVGNGTAALSSAATPVFLDEYSTAGALISTTASPTAVSGANRRLAVSGSAGSEGALSLSADGRYLTFVGYDAPVSSLTVATSPSYDRVVAVVNSNRDINTTTVLPQSAAYNTNNIRSAVTSDGTKIWTAGTATTGSRGGVRYTTAGATDGGIQLSSTPTNTRVVNIYNGQLYITSSTGSFTGVSSIGTGLPTSSGQSTSLLAGSTNAYGFAFFDRDPGVAGVDVLYLADQTNGILKYSYDGTAWTARGSISATGGATGLTAAINGSSVDLYVTTGTTAGNTLYKVTDAAAYNATITGSGSAITAAGTLLATAPANTVFRGVAFAPASAVAARPDLTVALSAPASATTNQPFAYSLVVSNAGTATASGIAVQFALPASGVTYNSAAGANGFTVDSPQSGTLVSFSSGTLAAGASATLTVTVTPTITGNVTSGTALVDPAGTIDESNETNNSAPAVTVSVGAGNQPPVAPTLANQTGVVAVPFSYTVPAFTDPESQPLTYSITGVPPGLSADNTTLVISGTPTTTGTSTVTVVATDPGSLSTAGTFTITINANQPPMAPSIPDQVATVGQAFSYTVPAFSDPENQSLTYDIAGLSNGLSADNTTRIISGTPTTTGLQTVTVVATDPASNTVSTTFSISVNAATTTAGKIEITEYAYDGVAPGGEFIELTNVGDAPVDMTGWSFDDNSRTAGSFPIGGFGLVQPGESVVIAESATQAFRTAWFLPPTVKVIGGNNNNLGRSDEINIYDQNDNLVDRLTYDDQTLGGPRTQNASAWTSPANLSATTATSAWVLSTVGDAQTSYGSVAGNIGNPGGYSIPLARVLVRETPTPNGTTTVTEGGATDTYTVSLNSAPTADVTIAITNPGSPLVVTPTSLTFTPSNFGTAQTVTVSADNDNVGQGNRTVTITQAASSADAAYNSIGTAVNPVSVTIIDGPVANPISISAVNNGPYLNTPTSGPAYVSGVISDPTDPASTSGLNFTISTASDFTITASSSDQTVVPTANLVLTGTGASRNLKITPTGVGLATITLSVSNSSATTSYVINYAASAASTSTSRFHTGSSDASTAQAVGTDYMFVGDDENQGLRLYNRNQSGLPVNTFDFTSQLGLTDISGGVPREVDIEASVQVGNRIYWLGSHSNKSDNGNPRPDRNRLFATDVSGTDASATLTYVGRYDNLKDNLANWDQANGHGLGANYLGLAASTATGTPGEGADGFNIEGLTTSPDNSAAYVAFRAPIEPASNRTKALIVPVTNFASLVTANPTTGPATFGAPILLDLGGRGIREIKKNSNNEYLIVAGSFGSFGAAPSDFRLYTWTGNPTDAPVLRSADLSGLGADDSGIESIVDLPSPLTPTSSIQFLLDNGDKVYYNNGTIAKDLAQNNWKKSRSDYATLGAALTPALAANPTTLSGFATPQGTASAPQTYTLSGSNLTVNVTVSAPAGYEVSQDGSTFGSNLSVAQAGGVVNATISTRLSATAVAGSVGGSVTNVSGSATATVALSGSVAVPASLAANPTALTGFTATQGTASASQSYTLSAVNLPAALTVTAPTGVAVSSDNSTFGPSLTLPQSTTSAIVFARLTAVATGAVSGTITNVSGSLSAGVAVSGSVSASVTPGGSGSVVISQVYGGAGCTTPNCSSYKNDYIELFNRGSVPVSVNGWSVQYASATGSSWQVTNLPNVSIPAGGYLLISEGTSTTTGVSNLPTPDATGTINMSSSAAKVALVSSTSPLSGTCPTGGTIVDFVGYGSTASCNEGGANAPAPANNSSAIFRAANGCTDTNNNGADFASAAAGPRNSSTAANPCVPTGPYITATPNPVSLSYVVGGGPVSQILTVNASNLSPDAGNITVSSSNTAVTLSNGGAFSSSITLPYTSGGLTSATFVAQLTSGLAVGSYPATLSLSGGGASATVTVNGTVSNAATSGAPTLISTIQGSGLTAALTGTQTIEGIVTRTFSGTTGLNGFYVQEEDADSDNNPNTSEAIFVYDPSGYFTGTQGSKVRLTGAVTEFTSTAKGNNSSLTEITLSATANLTVVSGGNPLPTVTNVTLPVASVSDLEKYEGMLVSLSAASGKLTVTEYFELGRYGQVLLSVDGASNVTGTDPRLDQYTQFNAPSVAGYSAYLAEIAKRRIYLDDGSSAQNPDPIIFARGGQPLSASNTLRGGDQVGSITAVLDERSEGYRLQTQTGVNFEPTNARPTTGPAVGGTLKAGNLNVLNYFNTFGTANFTNCAGISIGGRGATNSTELTRQRTKIVQTIITSGLDVMGINEMQNNGYGDNSAIQDLVKGLNDATAPYTYTFVNAGCISTDAITVAMIYKPAKVVPVGPASTTNTAAFTRVGRQPLAQTFRETATGGVFTLVSNHWKSKGSSAGGPGDADINDGQSASNGTRTEQARDLAAWLATQPTGTTDPDYLVVGDLNAYAKEDPLTTLENNGYANLVPNTTYSYVFDGFMGALDHALGSASLQAQVTGADKYHINADEPSVLDYNTDFKSAGQINSLYASDQYRSSDHDPVVVGLNLTGTASLSATLVASASAVCAGSPVNFSITVSGLSTGDTYSYTVSNGTNSTTASAVSATAVQTSLVPTVGGSYTLTVVSSANASATATSGNVAVNALPTNVSLTSGTLTCASTSVTLTASSTGGTTYSFSGGTPLGSNQVVVSQAGTYTVTASTPEGCTASATSTVTSNTATPVATLTASGTLTCANASVTLTAGGGTSYTFSAGATQIGTSNQAIVTTAGTYTVTVADANGCTSTTTTTVSSDTAAPTNVSLTSSGTLTCANTSVTLTATATGATAYTLSDGQSNASGQFVVNQPGTYTVTAGNANGCTATATTSVSQDNAAPQGVTASNTGPLTCANTSAVVSVSATTENLSYHWSGPNAFSSTAQSFTATVAGTYSVTATGANGCTAISSTSVGQSNNTPQNVTATNTGPLTCANTSATVSASSTTEGVSYQWSGPNGFSSAAQSFTTNVAGIYSVTTTSTGGCSTTASTTLGQDNAAPQNVTATNTGPLTCTNTSVVVSVSATTENLSYRWSGPNAFSSTAQSFTTTVAGTYSVTATGANGCTAISSTSVGQSNDTPQNVTASNTGPLTCANTSATVSVSSTTGGVSYRWSGPSGFSSTAQSFTTNVAGIYSVTTTSTGGCSTTASTTLGQDIAAPQGVTASNTGPLSCNNASVTVSASSTTGGVSYRWSGPNGFSSTARSFTTSTAGVYSVTVTGSNGCTATASTTVTGSVAFTITQGPASQTVCVGATVSFSVVASGSSAFTYAWYKNNTTSTVLATTPVYTFNASDGGKAGRYIVKVSSGSCASQQAEAQLTVNQRPNPPSLTSAKRVLCPSNDPVDLNQFVKTTNNKYTLRYFNASGQLLTSTSVVLNQPGSYGYSATQVDPSGGCESQPTAFTLTVNTTTKITAAPASQTACSGTNVTLTVQAVGTNLKYEWFKGSISNANKLSNNPSKQTGTTTASLTLVKVSASDNYFVRVTGDCGVVSSAAIRVTVQACGGRIGVDETPLTVRVLGNPAEGGQVRAEVRGVEGLPLRLALLTLQGQLVTERQVEMAGTVEEHTLPVGSSTGQVLLLQVSTPYQKEYVKVLVR